MSLEIEAYEGELKKLRQIYEIIDHTDLAMRLGNRYFLCGHGGQIDKNGLPDKLMVCPAYGVDWFHVYEKTNITSGTEW